MLLRQTFGPNPGVVREARALVAGVLDREGFPADAVFVAVLLTSELVTNAVRHARTDLEVVVSIDERLAHVAVVDRNTRLPQPALAPSDATTGRGLKLVDAMASAWGADHTPKGKGVWCEVSASM